MKIQGIEAVLFDMDGTLVSYENIGQGFWLQVYYDIADEFGVKPFEEKEMIKLSKKIKMKEKLVNTYNIKHDEYDKVFSKVFEKNIPKIIENLELYWDTKHVLQSISSKYKTGLITDQTENNRDRITGKFNLDKYFNIKVSPCVKGLRSKPSPDMILYAMDYLGVKNAVYVGDASVDIEASEKAGIKCILIERRDKRVEGYNPKIKNLFELEKMI